MPDGRPYIETLKRRGYRFNAVVRSSSSHTRNGNLNGTKITASLIDANVSQVRPTHFLQLLVGTWIIVACLFFGVFVASTTGWFAGSDTPKPAADVVVTPLTSGENVTQTTISHDGKYFVYSDYDGDHSRMVLQAVDRSSRSDILPSLTGQIENLSFTPDDREIYFVVAGALAEDNGLYRISVNGGSPKKVLQSITSPVFFSADGLKMVFVRPTPMLRAASRSLRRRRMGPAKRSCLRRETMKSCPQMRL